MSEPFLGQIIMFGGNFAIRGWAFCNGQLLSIAQNTALFSLLGTTYGGDGVTTFALPDLRGRVVIHAGQGPGLPNYSQGEMAGSQSVTLTISQMPSHNHLVMADPNGATTVDPSNDYMGSIGAGNVPATYSAGPPTAPMGPQSITPSGGSQPFSIVQSYNVVNYLIALEGIYPSRN